MNAVAERMPQQVSAVATPMELLDRAVQNGASIEMIDKLMTLQERWEHNQARKAFDEAMAAAKAEIPVIQKNRKVDFTSQRGRTNYSYEDLAGVASVVNPILAKHGLSYRFRTSSAPNEPVHVTCIVSHRMGYFEENTLCAGRDESGNKNSIQAIGSTLTYLQRMTLKAALGLAAAADDDGQSSESDNTISDEQITNLRSLIVEVAADIPKFCAYMKVEKIEDIPAGQYKKAVASLEAKRGRA